MNIGILGAGMSGISLANLLQDSTTIAHVELLEQADAPGGLCRSYRFGGIACDVGPHALFSQNSEILELLVRMLGNNVHKLRRSNKIYHNERFIKYPFENELAALSTSERDYCLDTFLNNPYAQYPRQNMLQFFLATFGEGITNLYLRPYNEKIWKFDPAFMDTQMVGRIPKPLPEDIIKSAQGTPTEGYLHQLYFYYPRFGGIQSLTDAFLNRLGDKVSVLTDCAVDGISKWGDHWHVTSGGLDRTYDRLVSTIPIPNLIAALNFEVPQAVRFAAESLKYNSIAICLLHVSHDCLGDNFAIMVADRTVLCHRVSKLDFLTPREERDTTTRIMAEITYRQLDWISRMPDSQLISRVIDDLVRLRFIESREVVLAEKVVRHQYAYVIYDLDHYRNVQTVRQYCEHELGLILHGRFGEFAYLNIDNVLERSRRRAEEILGSVSY